MIVVVNGLQKKISKVQKIYAEEGLKATLSHVLNFLLIKIGWYRDKWILGKLIELGGNIAWLDGSRFDLSSPLIPTTAKSSFIQKTYENKERRVIKRILDSSLPVIELGASIGVVSCITNKLLKNREKHIVVEANPNLIQILEKNRELNNCSFQILNRAVGYGSDRINFYINEKFLSGSAQRKTDKIVSVPTITLADIFNRSGFKKANLICDIEGAEGGMIENEIGIIAQKVYQLILEVHPGVIGEDRVNQIRKVLEDNGLQKVQASSYSSVWVFVNNSLGIVAS